MTPLTLHRAPDHRHFLGPEFDAGPDGPDPQGLSYAEIMADPKLAALGQQVYAQLRAQFAEQSEVAAQEETPEEEKYRLKLEGWADILEILLEETLLELDRLGSARASKSGRGGGAG